MTRLGRRGFLLGTALIAAGCSAGTERRSVGPTRTVDTHMGPVQVPVAPRRVVCLDQYSTLAMLDAGLRPTATIDNLDAWMPAEQLATYRELPRVGGYQADPERILSMKPDLIIGNSAFTLSGSGVYNSLSSIAPTVILTAATAGQWPRMALQVADVVNHSEPMRRLRDRYHNKAHGIRQRYAKALAERRFSLVAAFESGQWNLCLPDSWSGVVLAEAGCRFGAASEQETGNAKELSFEQLGVLSDSDVIFYQVNPNGELETPMREMLDQPGFQRLPAVSSGNAVPMRNLYVFSYTQALGALDELEAVLKR